MKTLVIVLMLLTSGSAYAVELVLVANTSFNHQLTKSDLINIYLGRSKTLADGTPIAPIDQVQGTREKQAFYEWLVNKNVNEIRAYWSRLIFSGRSTPPVEAPSPQAVIELVKTDPSMIGYIDKRDITNDVKVIEDVD